MTQLQEACPGLYSEFQEATGQRLDDALWSLYLVFVRRVGENGTSSQRVPESSGEESAPRPYGDAAEESNALRAHPIYCWMAKGMPTLIRRVEEYPQTCWARILLSVLTHVIFVAMPAGAQDRSGKEPDATGTNLKAVNVAGVTLIASSVARRKSWFATLTWLAALLMKEQAQKPVGHPFLLSFAREMARICFGKESAAVVLEFAQFRKIPCNEQTAKTCAEDGIQAWEIGCVAFRAPVEDALLFALAADYRSANHELTSSTASQ